MSRLERIVSAWGGILLHGGHRALVRAPGHGAGDRSVSLLETEDDRLIVHCFSPQEDWRGIRDALARDGLLEQQSFADAPCQRSTTFLVQPLPECKLTRAKKVWGETRPLRASAAETYLRRRAIRRTDWNDDALRCHRAATALDDRGKRPAMIAAIRGANGELQGIQVTLLTRYGERKAHVATPRRIIGHASGGAVQIDPPSDILVVSEGVETALAASEALGLPAWAALSAVLLAQFEPPPMVERLVIAADDDDAGRSAAARLCTRLRSRVRVEIVLPGDGFKDWNDRAVALRHGA